MAKKKAAPSEGMKTFTLYLKQQGTGKKSFSITEHWIWGDDGVEKFMAARQEEAHKETKSPYQVSIATQEEYRAKNWHSRRAA